MPTQTLRALWFKARSQTNEQSTVTEGFAWLSTCQINSPLWRAHYGSCLCIIIIRKRTSGFDTTLIGCKMVHCINHNLKITLCEAMSQNIFFLPYFSICSHLRDMRGTNPLFYKPHYSNENGKNPFRARQICGYVSNFYLCEATEKNRATNDK